MQLKLSIGWKIAFRVLMSVRALLVIVGALLQSIDFGHAAWLYASCFPNSILLVFMGEKIAVIDGIISNKYGYASAVAFGYMFTLIVDILMFVVIYWTVCLIKSSFVRGRLDKGSI